MGRASFKAGMNRDEAMMRDARGLPIEHARELVLVLANVQRRRTVKDTPIWFLLNRLRRLVMDVADLEDAGLPIADRESLEERLARLERYVDEIAEHPTLSIPPLPTRESMP